MNTLKITAFPSPIAESDTMSSGFVSALEEVLEMEALQQKVVLLQKESLTQKERMLFLEKESETQKKESLTQKKESLTQKERMLFLEKESETQKKESLTQKKESLTQKERMLFLEKESLTQKERIVFLEKERSFEHERMLEKEKVDQVKLGRVLRAKREQEEKLNEQISLLRRELRQKLKHEKDLQDMLQNIQEYTISLEQDFHQVETVFQKQIKQANDLIHAKEMDIISIQHLVLQFTHHFEHQQALLELTHELPQELTSLSFQYNVLNTEAHDVIEILLEMNDSLTTRMLKSEETFEHDVYSLKKILLLVDGKLARYKLY
jgi:hypothetical protein